MLPSAEPLLRLRAASAAAVAATVSSCMSPASLILPRRVLPVTARPPVRVKIILRHCKFFQHERFALLEVVCDGDSEYAKISEGYARVRDLVLKNPFR